MSLGLPFVKTFYTSLNYTENFVYFGVSTTVSVRGTIKISPPILVMYLGLTINILPGIIAAFCMDYHYCPKRRLHQRINRMKNLNKKLESQNEELKEMGIRVTLINEY